MASPVVGCGMPNSFRHRLWVKLWSDVPGYRLNAYSQFSCQRHYVDRCDSSHFADEMRAHGLLQIYCLSELVYAG
jgi:hypothetical protein